MKYTKDELPERGKDVIGYTKEGEKKYVFLCNTPGCMEWRCSVSGFGLLVDIDKWEYEKS
jgi:hypothetical protein